MSFFKNLFSGAATGALSAAVRGTAPRGGIGFIEDLCAQIGWGIDSREGDNSIGLHFKDPVFRIRPVHVTASNTSELVILTTYSRAKFSADEVPAKLAYHLLNRNKEAFFHSWRLSENDDGTVGFANWCVTFSSVLQPTLFQTICESMCRDAGELDAKLRQAGLV